MEENKQSGVFPPGESPEEMRVVLRSLYNAREAWISVDFDKWSDEDVRTVFKIYHKYQIK